MGGALVQELYGHPNRAVARERILRKNKKIKTKVTVTLTNAAGQSSTASTKVTLTR